MNFRGLIWKRVWKITFLVRYRVRIGRTARNTPRGIPRTNPPSPTTWHVIFRGETRWNTRYWDLSILFNRIRPKYALKWRYSRSNGETVSYIWLAANCISYITTANTVIYNWLPASQFDRFFVWCNPVVTGSNKSCKVWFDCEFCELFSMKAKLLENFKKPITVTQV